MRYGAAAIAAAFFYKLQIVASKALKSKLKDNKFNCRIIQESIMNNKYEKGCSSCIEDQ